VVTLTLARPDSLNSLDAELREALRDTLAALDTDPECRAVVLTGAGRAFCVGQDLREHIGLLETGTDDPLKAVREHYNPTATRLVADGEAALPAAHELAARLAAGPTTAYAAIKRQLAIGGSGSLADALAAEAAAQQRCGATADHVEATRAFVAKRRPAFTGR